MKTSSEGFQQCCNVQVAVAGKNQTIVSTVVGRWATDQGQLQSMVEATAATGGRMLAEVLPDAGYCNEADPAARVARGNPRPCGAGPGGPEARRHRHHGRPATHRMGEHVATPNGRAAYAERNWL